MTSNEVFAFATDWTEEWNRRDIEGVLARFADEVVFTSPRALEVVGVAEVRGKPALRAYWGQALASIASIRFILDRVVWDPDRRELAIVYTSEINGRGKRVAEHLRFDQDGQVTTGEVFHGTPAAPAGVPRAA